MFIMSLPSSTNPFLAFLCESIRCLNSSKSLKDNSMSNTSPEISPGRGEKKVILGVRYIFII